MAQMRQRHGLQAQDMAQVRIHMNAIETVYPSPAFARHEDWQLPRVWDSTHYFAARTAVAGSFPVANGLPPGAPDSDPDNEAQARAFMARIKLVPEPQRAMFSPTIAIELQNGKVLQDSHPYERMVWNFDQLLSRLQACTGAMEGGQKQHDGLASLVLGLDGPQTLQALVRHMQGQAV
jgi:hypothetical protein